MPYRPSTRCKHGMCSKLVPYGTNYCDEHKKLYPRFSKEYDNDYKSLYKTSRWYKMRKQFLNANPFCVECAKDGRTVKANIVDHIKPHRGDANLFYDTSNWQALCKECHDKKTLLKDVKQNKGITYTYENTKI